MDDLSVRRCAAAACTSGSGERRLGSPTRIRAGSTPGTLLGHAGGAPRGHHRRDDEQEIARDKQQTEQRVKEEAERTSAPPNSTRPSRSRGQPDQFEQRRQDVGDEQSMTRRTGADDYCHGQLDDVAAHDEVAESTDHVCALRSDGDLDPDRTRPGERGTPAPTSGRSVPMRLATWNANTEGSARPASSPGRSERARRPADPGDEAVGCAGPDARICASATNLSTMVLGAGTGRRSRRVSGPRMPWPVFRSPTAGPMTSPVPGRHLWTDARASCLCAERPCVDLNGSEKSKGGAFRTMARRNDLSAEPAICGDYNVAPDDPDAWDPPAAHGGTHVSPRSGRCRKAVGWPRRRVPPPPPEPGCSTCWDDPGGHFQKNFGLRTPCLRDRGTGSPTNSPWSRYRRRAQSPRPIRAPPRLRLQSSST